MCVTDDSVRLSTVCVLGLNNVYKLYNIGTYSLSSKQVMKQTLGPTPIFKLIEKIIIIQFFLLKWLYFFWIFTRMSIA